jgi:asparagine synthase (glutamine-hydrolysing)
MCGIAGYLTFQGDLPNRSTVKRMCDRLAHRGPDSEGFFVDRHAALGHRRLSIIDLSSGDQPMSNEDGNLQIIFNGEIYNYLELRSRLIQKGHRFATNSDTEVIVHLYEDEGEHTPEHLNGMFAFVIWDSRRKQLFAARDRFGKKPLYYSLTVPGIRFCFASELKALLTLPGFPAEVDQYAVADFLALSYISPPATIFKSVRQLRPGESITLTEDDERLTRYWQPRFDIQSRPLDQVIEEIHTLAADSVERRMISDVPLGAFLSGGVDSSAVVAFMARKARDQVKTFSIGFTDKRYDELQYARLVASRYHTDHHETVVAPRIEDVLDEHIEHYDEPFADPSAIPMLYLSRMTREHVTVALSGDGADELFGGYRRYYFGLIEERIRHKFPGWFRHSVFQTASKYYPKFDYLPQVFRAKAMLRNLSTEFGDAYFASMSAFAGGSRLRTVLSEGMISSLRDYAPRQAFVERFHAVGHLPPLQQMQAVDFETYLPGDILVKADRATMAYSLESRSPWLDYRLAELACRLPTDLKIHGKTGKFVFKKMLEPYLQRILLGRRKMGFSVPLESWFRTSLKPVFEARVLHNDMQAYLNLDEVRRLWNEHQSGLHDHSKGFWNLLMLASWDQRYNTAGKVSAQGAAHF